MAADQIQIARVAADRPPLAGDERLTTTLGGFLAAAVPDFYSLVPLDAGSLNCLLGKAIGMPRSEFEDAFMAGTPEEPCGIATSLPANELGRAQQASTIMLMRHVTDVAGFRTAAADYSKMVEPIDGRGRYLSRVTVASRARGQGLGRRLVEQIIALADGDDVWLHVSADNEAAIGLYQALGFEFASNSPYRSRAMRRAER
jgi:ribosomal protein S18 acetylase RimI-like enzyme